MPCRCFDKKLVYIVVLAGAMVVAVASRLLAQNNVYYSVGVSTADLKTTANINITSGTATFSANQAVNIGVGDEISAGGNKYYISGRTSASAYTVTTRTGATPANLATTALSYIKRAFNSLTQSVNQASDSNHLGTATLYPSYNLHFPMYKDGDLLMPKLIFLRIQGAPHVKDMSVFTRLTLPMRLVFHKGI